MNQTDLWMKVFVLGPIQTNCYLAGDKKSGDVLVIDPAQDAARLSAAVREAGGQLKAVLLTHGHHDHIGAVEELRREWGAQVYAGEEEEELLASPQQNLSDGLVIRPDQLLKDGDVLELAGRTLRVIHTPGHTKGCVCYYDEEAGVLFAGDTLFYASVGRTDLPTGSMSALVRSIREKLLVLPEDTMVCPGHGQATSIGFEKKYNPFIF